MKCHLLMPQGRSLCCTFPSQSEIPTLQFINLLQSQSIPRQLQSIPRQSIPPTIPPHLTKVGPSVPLQRAHNCKCNVLHRHTEMFTPRAVFWGLPIAHQMKRTSRCCRCCLQSLHACKWHGGTSVQKPGYVLSQMSKTQDTLHTQHSTPHQHQGGCQG